MNIAGPDVLRDVAEIAGEYSGMSRTVLEYAMTIEGLVVDAKEPGFGPQSFAPLGDLVDIDNFVRVGNFKEVMNWREYVDFLTGWAPASNWECSFKRVTETGKVVFLELEERVVVGDDTHAVNSLSVYEFNGLGKIAHIAVYLQMPVS